MEQLKNKHKEVLGEWMDKYKGQVHDDDRHNLFYALYICARDDVTEQSLFSYLEDNIGRLIFEHNGVKFGNYPELYRIIDVAMDCYRAMRYVLFCQGKIGKSGQMLFNYNLKTKSCREIKQTP